MDDNFNLIGNPYLSAIRFTDFMAANTDLEGPMRVWTHGTLPSNANGNPFYGSFVYNYMSNDYIIHNGTGTGITDFESQEIQVVTNEKLIIYSTNELIKELVVYDVLGGKINHYFNINANEIALKEQKTNQALILKVTLENGIIINKKILY
jgi:hypothetical protein